MAAPDQVNPGEELTRRFRADLARPVGERFYSEDDLIDIFDYAGDIADDYLRMEALLLGARLSPDSVELTERRAIFYLYLDRRAFKAYLEDNPAVDTPLWQILRLNLLNPGDPAVERVLQSFVDHAGRLTDEEFWPARWAPPTGCWAISTTCAPMSTTCPRSSTRPPCRPKTAASTTAPPSWWPS